ncbi:MAG: NAD-dependent epimerase/dehydratase family protein [Deltaproteobacteria bacterium]|nr:NAD-dependent epimerase/dehydratase family protein [Deltaproteobacteria bacterium]
MNVGESSPGPVVVVTGGAGFLGRALVRELRKPASETVLRPSEIRVLDIRPAPPELSGTTFLRGDVLEPDDLRRAFEGADLVFHLAALIDWGQNPAERVHAVNATGTRNVVAACRAAGVPSLVATSSLDVVYAGHSLHDVDETTPYPTSYPSAYCASKAEAERAVREADGTVLDGGRRLRTIVVRPGSIWGENDPYHVGAMLELARRGPVVRLGRESAPTHFTYVGNVAHAVALAGKALREGREEACGQVFFVSDFPPKNFFDHLEPMVRAAGGRMLPKVLALPRGPMRLLGRALELASEALRPIAPFRPLFTTFSVDYVCNTFTVKSDKAERLLGYRPIYGEAEAYERTLAAVRGGVGR